MVPSGALGVFVACMIFGGALALDMSKLKPYNTTALEVFLQEDPDDDGSMDVPEIEATFTKYDKNGDGRITRQEYTMMVCEADPALYQISHYLFDAYDANGDHHLERADFDAWHAKIDADGGGTVSREEFVSYWVTVSYSACGLVPSCTPVKYEKRFVRTFTTATK